MINLMHDCIPKYDLEYKRISKDEYYLNIAHEVATRGTCLRRNFGSVIVKNDRIVSTGYTGAPRGRKNCIDLKTCKREELQVPAGTRYELCRSCHSEMNAIISASKEEMLGATLYLVGIDMKTGKDVTNARPCSLCKRCIINAGIETVVVRGQNEYGNIEVDRLSVQSWIDDENLDEYK